ncbi:MAG TPA: hypothetical protein VL137_17225 [Polyangiaceae bacterium]|nr:hypothetical protein [Polyangiaceae bacterium]
MRLIATDGTTLLVLGNEAQITAGKRPQLFVRIPMVVWKRISNVKACNLVHGRTSRTAVLLRNYDSRNEIARFDLGPRTVIT